jgi:hypothetical protein
MQPGDLRMQPVASFRKLGTVPCSVRAAKLRCGLRCDEDGEGKHGRNYTATGKVIDACVGHDIGYEDSKHEYVIRVCRRIQDSGSADEVLVLPRGCSVLHLFKDDED